MASPPTTMATRPERWFQPSAPIRIGSGATYDSTMPNGEPVTTTANRSAEARPDRMPTVRALIIVERCPAAVAGLGADRRPPQRIDLPPPQGGGEILSDHVGQEPESAGAL